MLYSSTHYFTLPQPQNLLDLEQRIDSRALPTKYHILQLVEIYGSNPLFLRRKDIASVIVSDIHDVFSLDPEKFKNTLE